MCNITVLQFKQVHFTTCRFIWITGIRSKQCRPWSYTANRSIWYGPTIFAQNAWNKYMYSSQGLLSPDIQFQNLVKWASTCKIYKMACEPSKDSDQSGHPSSLISLSCVLNGLLRTKAFFMRAAQTLIRLVPRLIGVFAERTIVMTFCRFFHTLAHMYKMTSSAPD